MNKEQSAKAELISASVIFGTVGLIRKAVPLSSAMLSMVRGFIGAAVMIVIMLLKRQKPDMRAVKRVAGYLLASGIAIGVNWILLFESYRYTSVSVATLCYYMAPVFTLIASPFVLGEKLTLRNVLAILVALAGMILVSGVIGEKSDSEEITGILLGLGAAVLYASVVLLNRKISGITASDRTVFQLLVAGIVLVPYVIVSEDGVYTALTWKTVMCTAVMGVVNTGFAYSLYFDSISTLKTQTVALFTYIDPVVAIMISALFLGERLGISGIAGAVLILGATVYNELSPSVKK
ncbi:MAG: DMT family transporter [Sphaerochaetaceae bacterium]|nr:DMT family transporter [Sphaerochaetaceae bacterium]